MVTPDDQIVKAIGNLSLALRHQINACRKEEMEVLLKMNNILSNATVEKSDGKKKVTFKDPIPPPKIATSASNLKQTPKTVSSPRVIAKAIVDKPLRTMGVVSGPTTQSKYAQALTNIINKSEILTGRVAHIRKQEMQCKWSSDQCPTRVVLTITELAEAVLDDDSKAALEFAIEIFDADSGQMLKYQQLISHPKHCDIGMHSSANEFGRLAQGVGNRIKGTDMIFFIGLPFQIPHFFKFVIRGSP